MQFDLGQAAQLHLTQNSVLLSVTEHGLDQLARELADSVSDMARRASIDPARAARGVLCHVRCDVDLATALDEGLDVVGFVSHSSRSLRSP